MLLILINSYLELLSSICNSSEWEGKLVLVSGGCWLQNKNSKTSYCKIRRWVQYYQCYEYYKCYEYLIQQIRISKQFSQNHFLLVLLAQHLTIQLALRVQWDWTYEKGERDTWCLSCYHDFMQINCNATWYIGPGKKPKLSLYPDTP